MACGLGRILSVKGMMLTVLAASVTTAQMWQPVRPRAIDYLGESGGALVGGAGIVLAFAGGMFFPGNEDDMGIPAASYCGLFTGVVLGYPTGCGLGTTLVGEALHVDGNTAAAYGGAFAGLLTSGALEIIGHQLNNPGEYVVYGLVATIVLAPPAGAVIGYSVGATRGEPGPDFGGRVLPPAVAFSTRSTSDRQTHTFVDCRLVTVRF